MPTLDATSHPEHVSYDQQLAAEAARQASGAPPSLAPDVASAVSAPGSASAQPGTGRETQFMPRPYHVGLYDLPSLCRPAETLLIFKETAGLFKGHAYELKDSEGVTVIEVKGRAVSLHDTKDILAANGDLLFTLKNKLVGVRRTFEGVRDGAPLFEIKRSLGGSMACTFENMALASEVGLPNSPSAASIALRGNFHDGTGDLVFQRGSGEEITIAQVRHSVVAGHSLVRDSQTYFVKVAAGVDLALVGTICLCFEQLREEKGNH